MISRKPDAKAPKDSRAERLAAELRANLKKRKEQVRARQAAGPGRRQDDDDDKSGKDGD
jgi:hypothetical protein